MIVSCRDSIARVLYRVAMAVDPMPRVEVDRRAHHQEPARNRQWQALIDIAGYEGWQTPGVPAAKAMGDIARAAIDPLPPP